MFCSIPYPKYHGAVFEDCQVQLAIVQRLLVSYLSANYGIFFSMVVSHYQNPSNKSPKENGKLRTLDSTLPFRIILVNYGEILVRYKNFIDHYFTGPTGIQNFLHLGKLSSW